MWTKEQKDASACVWFILLFVVSLDFSSTVLSLLLEFFKNRENPRSYRAFRLTADALREACNAINAAAASNATLIDADPEKK